MYTHCSSTTLSRLILVGVLALAAAYANAQQPTSKEYIIGAGDTLQIQVWGHDDLSRTVEISPNGTFSFPFIGKIKASGKSVSDIENSLVQKLSDGYLVGPQVTISVSEYKHKKAFLFGEVERPGSYVLRNDMRLLELITEAGGFTDNRGRRCTIIRSKGVSKSTQPVPIEDATGHEIITIDIALMISGDPKSNILISPNDSIYISTAEKIFVTGEVRRPGEIEYTDGMTVRQAISKAGGGTPQAAIGRTQIMRMKDGNEISIKPKLSDLVSPNDILKIPESYF